MKLGEALRINQKGSRREGESYIRATAACGFTAIQFEQFLTAHLYSRFPDQRVVLGTLPYGDLISNLGNLDQDCGATFLIVEWQDLDPRLGLRRCDWRPSVADDILKTVSLRLEALALSLKNISQFAMVFVSLPRLPLPQVAPGRFGAVDSFKLTLEELILDFTDNTLDLTNTHLLSRTFPGVSPVEIHDSKSDVRYDIPYTQEFQSKLVRAMVNVAFPAPPLKGLITDLDNTLWSGVIGDIGPDQVSWDIDNRTHIHSVYQQCLAALNEMGVFLAVASKNETDVAEKGLARSDLRLNGDCFFPREIHWDSKSTSVSRILDTWNIGPESVLFVDDSEAELAEVKAIHPEILTARFEPENYPSTLYFIQDLRRRFGCEIVSTEAKIRASSIRNRAEVEKKGKAIDSEAFLKTLESKVTIVISREDDPRAFELINKTNQFNLNGNRLSENDWLQLRNDDGTLIVKLDYEDKFGPLGRICVLIGKPEKNLLRVTSWVLSCRAFSRRLEYLILRVLFDRLNYEKIVFEYRSTEKNKPLATMLSKFDTVSPSHGFILEKARFYDQCPALHSTLEFHDDN